jgi:hypothetical protein
VESENFKDDAFDGIPEWIIRNGINDEAQDSNTDFGTVSGKNGNGAVAFKGVGWEGTGRFVTVGINSKQVAWSDDGGETWTVAETLPTPENFYCNWVGLAYGNGVFVTVASGGNQAAWSDDGGQTWTGTTLPGSSSRDSVAYGGGRFVAVAQDDSNDDDDVQAAWSGDGGQTWNEGKMAGNISWRGLAYGGSRFVTVARTSKKAAWSTDGENWTEVAMPGSGDDDCRWLTVVYGKRE